jgi:hypothetical protein
MARKKSSSSSKSLLPSAAGFLALVALGFLYLGSKDKSTHRTVPALDVGAYLQNSNSLRGNTYKLEGKVAESLAWSPDSGRLIAIEVDNEIIPVLVTADFNEMNIQKEQRLVFLVAVDEKGILRTRMVEKS